MKFKDLAIGTIFTQRGSKIRFRKTGETQCIGVDKISTENSDTLPERFVFGPRNRFDDAIEIQEGAVNMMAITNALHRALTEINETKPRPSTYEGDAAVRMIVHQMAFLCKVGQFDDPAGYDTAMTACEENRMKKEMTL